MYTGAEQTWTVPSTVTEIVVEAYGAQGGAGNAYVTGGLGGYAIANIPVTPGEVLEIRVGGQGTSTVSGAPETVLVPCPPTRISRTSPGVTGMFAMAYPPRPPVT